MLLHFLPSLADLPPAACQFCSPLSQGCMPASFPPCHDQADVIANRSVTYSEASAHNTRCCLQQSAAPSSNSSRSARVMHSAAALHAAHYNRCVSHMSASLANQMSQLPPPYRQLPHCWCRWKALWYASAASCAGCSASGSADRAGGVAGVVGWWWWCGVVWGWGEGGAGAGRKQGGKGPCLIGDKSLEPSRQRVYRSIGLHVTCTTAHLRLRPGECPNNGQRSFGPARYVA